MTGEFDPAEYQDEYREALMQVIESKVEGHEVEAPEPAEETGKLVDLMAALEASVNAAKAARERRQAGLASPRPRRRARARPQPAAKAAGGRAKARRPTDDERRGRAPATRKRKTA